MKFVLTNGTKFFIGNHINDLINQACIIRIDYDKRELYINGQLDSITYSSEYNDVELTNECYARALKLLNIMYNYKLYKLLDN